MLMSILMKIPEQEILEMQKKSLEDFRDFVRFCKNYDQDIPKEIVDRKKEAILEYFERMSK